MALEEENENWKVKYEDLSKKYEIMLEDINKEKKKNGNRK